MIARQSRKNKIWNTIVDMLPANSVTIKQVIGKMFDIQGAAVNKHLRTMLNEEIINASAETNRSRSFTLKTENIFSKQYTITEDLAEDYVWRDDIAPLLENTLQNARDIYYHAFTEMFNNAMDHSDGTTIGVTIYKYFNGYKIYIQDNGVGIFGKIQKEFNLHDKKQAILELSKGKLTTDPNNHSGEGIFFTSRAVDHFVISADGLLFHHKKDNPLDMIDDIDDKLPGTIVMFALCSQTEKNIKDIFDEFAPADEYTFGKTIVPVHLAQYEQDSLISRSQAKRVLARIENFKFVVFDFEGVDQIGQAFADEIFRVFQIKYPDITIHAANTTKDIDAMIQRALSK